MLHKGVMAEELRLRKSAGHWKVTKVSHGVASFGDAIYSFAVSMRTIFCKTKLSRCNIFVVSLGKFDSVRNARQHADYRKVHLTNCRKLTPPRDLEHHVGASLLYESWAEHGHASVL